MTKLPFLVGPRGVLPVRPHDSDAGFDLFTSEHTTIAPGEFRDLPTDVAGAIPNGYWGLLTGRSSTLRRYGLLVHQGVIDAGYRGELFAGVMNLSNEDVVIPRGTRVAQLILIPLGASFQAQAVAVEDFPAGERGQAGFGSSGT